MYSAKRVGTLAFVMRLLETVGAYLLIFWWYVFCICSCVCVCVGNACKLCAFMCACWLVIFLLVGNTLTVSDILAFILTKTTTTEVMVKQQIYRKQKP